MGSNAPKPPSQQPKSPAVVNTRNFLFYGIGISLLVHLLLGPLVNIKQLHQEEQEVTKVTTVKTIVHTPKPTPTPKPEVTPTPPPRKDTPPPSTPQPQTKKLKVDVPKSTSKSKGGPAESAYNVKVGGQEGNPAGNSDTGPPVAAATVAPATATPTPVPPTPTPAPKCAVPNADASIIDKVQPELPEIARSQGASGTAQIKVDISPTGSVTSATVYKTSNNRALDNAAVQAAKASKYTPDIRNCEKIAGSYLFVAVFENN